MPDAEIANLFISETGLQIPDHPLTAVGGLVGRAGLLLEGQPLVCDLAERLGRPLDRLLSPSHPTGLGVAGRTHWPRYGVPGPSGG